MTLPGAPGWHLPDPEAGSGVLGLLDRERIAKWAGPEAERGKAGEGIAPVRAQAGVLEIGLDADHKAGAGRELIIVADLTATHEAVAVPACP